MGVNGRLEHIEVTLSIRTRSENNMHGNWRSHAARAKKQREYTYNVLSGFPVPTDMCSADVALTRISPRELDGDNLQGALKAVRDGVTDWMSGGYNTSNRKGGTNDRDKRIRWLYYQRKGEPKKYAVRISIVWEEGMPAYLAGHEYGGYPEGTAIIVDGHLCLKCLEIGRPSMTTGKPMCVGCGQEFTNIVQREELGLEDDDTSARGSKGCVWEPDVEDSSPQP